MSVAATDDAAPTILSIPSSTLQRKWNIMRTSLLYAAQQCMSQAASGSIQPDVSILLGTGLLAYSQLSADIPELDTSS